MKHARGAPLGIFDDRQQAGRCPRGVDLGQPVKLGRSLSLGDCPLIGDVRRGLAIWGGRDRVPIGPGRGRLPHGDDRPSRRPRRRARLGREDVAIDLLIGSTAFR